MNHSFSFWTFSISNGYFFCLIVLNSTAVMWSQRIRRVEPHWRWHAKPGAKSVARFFSSTAAPARRHPPPRLLFSPAKVASRVSDVSIPGGGSRNPWTFMIHINIFSRAIFISSYRVVCSVRLWFFFFFLSQDIGNNTVFIILYILADSSEKGKSKKKRRNS